MNLCIFFIYTYNSSSLSAHLIMAQLAGPDEIESFRIELAEIGRSIRTSFRSHVSSFRSVSTVKSEHGRDADDEDVSQWVDVERLPTFERITTALFEEQDGTAGNGDVKGGRELLMFPNLELKNGICSLRSSSNTLKMITSDCCINLGNELTVGVQLPTVEVRYKNLCVESECEIVQGKPLPTLWNTAKSILSGIANLSCSKQRTKISIIKDVSGVIKPGSRREKQAGILPDSDVDAYMKAISVEGLKSNLQTDYILKILGLDICADTMVGDAMRRGISGGQKKRLTTGFSASSFYSFWYT
ncbi:hypothetical protein NC652_034272 [Populus alba x Populus x berolinensis]|nr:hypothetical protein NC652_034272 [Populus alba x Populus x berolinensis]